MVSVASSLVMLKSKILDKARLGKMRLEIRINHTLFCHRYTVKPPQKKQISRRKLLKPRKTLNLYLVIKP